MPTEYRDARRSQVPETYHLTVGREYVVFAMTAYLGGLWIYIADDQFSYYPVWHPTPLFQIVDGRISTSWRVGLQGPVGRQDLILAYEEWAKDPTYYERLVDGDEALKRSFLLHKERLEREFSEP